MYFHMGYVKLISGTDHLKLGTLIQFFDKHGHAVHKVYTTPKTNLDNNNKYTNKLTFYNAI